MHRVGTIVPLKALRPYPLKTTISDTSDSTKARASHMSCLPRLPNELLHEVCSSPCLSQHDRSALARVSKDWHHVATPVLWRQLPGILPLLKLIPEDAWTSELIQYDDFQWPDDPTERIVSRLTHMSTYLTERLTSCRRSHGD